MQTPLPYRGPEPYDRTAQDLSHLNVLAICHYVWGGLDLLFSCGPLIYAGLGIGMLVNPEAFQDRQRGEQMPEYFAWFFLGCGVLGTLFSWVVGILNLLSARSIQKRERRMLTLVMAGINCISVPLGTVLGVFTFLVLSRPSVKALYGVSPFAPPPA